jgi:adenylate cyclase
MKPALNNYARKVNRTYLITLIIAYVAGMNIFVLLKMLGLKELNEIDLQTQQALLPLSLCMALLIALGIAFMEVHIFSRWENYPVGRFILYKYSVIIFLITTGCIIVFIFFAQFFENKSFSASLQSIPGFLQTEIFLSVFLYLILFSILLNMIKTIYDYLGPQAIVGALLGKYSQPVEEDLTFLFIDLQASTRIAEQLGHLQYSRFIESSFQLLTESIHQYNATLYQFVGDEAVLLWPTRTAKKTLAPLKLYFDFIDKIDQQSNHFTGSFGETPRFKAAIHTGLVTVTEIRTIKRDIVYHGDVLNTCARMLEQCSALKKNLLVSSPIASWLQEADKFSASFTTQLTFRGKASETAIYEIKTITTAH